MDNGETWNLNVRKSNTNILVLVLVDQINTGV